MGAFSRKKDPSQPSTASEDTLTPYQTSSTLPLRIYTSIAYLISIIFLILVCIGSINNKAVIRDTYFLKISLADIIPASVPNAVLINSIARSIGLHDFYQVGLWGFCEGYDGQGITYCSPPKTLYWFNPVQIILNELLAGATIALPGEVTSALHLVKIASHWMFACFLTAACLTFVCIFIAPMGFSSKPRWTHKKKRIFTRALPVTFISFCAALFTIGASAIATVMFAIFRNVFTGQPELNVGAELGTSMLAYMWIASGFNLFGFIMQFGTCCGVCCCTGRKSAEKRAMKTGVSNGIVEKDNSNVMGQRFGWNKTNKRKTTTS